MSASVAKARADAAHASGEVHRVVSPVSELQSSALATQCFHMWSQGRLSSTAMQEIALFGHARWCHECGAGRASFDWLSGVAAGELQERFYEKVLQ